MKYAENGTVLEFLIIINGLVSVSGEFCEVISINILLKAATAYFIGLKYSSEEVDQCSRCDVVYERNTCRT